MKVLWFTNIPLPEMVGAANCTHATSGSWMVALSERLSGFSDVEVAVACAAPGLSGADQCRRGRIKFYAISQGSQTRLFAFRSLDNQARYLHACVQVVKEVAPDVVHIHGSERFYGLLGSRGLVSSPIIISLQGLLHDLADWRHYFGVTPAKDLLRMHCSPRTLTGRGPLFDYFRLLGSAKRELEILKGNNYFMGRTLWDRAHLRAVNPQALYFLVPELLRPRFTDERWDIGCCHRHRIIFSNAGSFYRGTETLLDAVAILKNGFPDTRLALAGGVERTEYGKRLLRKIAALGLQNSVDFVGSLNEERMARELRNSHIFAITSFLENSPNSLCEAQIVGLPCVASYVGGIPSLVEEGVTGLFFPSGDAAVLAERIREIFCDDALAKRLGARARAAALERHDPESVTTMLLKTYKAVIRMSEKRNVKGD